LHSTGSSELILLYSFVKGFYGGISDLAVGPDVIICRFWNLEQRRQNI